MTLDVWPLAAPPPPYSCRALAGDAAPGRLVCLTACSIPAPVVMTLAAPVQLDCHVDAASGEVQLRSSSKLSKAATLHFRATACSLARTPLDQAGGEGSPRPSGASSDSDSAASNHSKDAVAAVEADAMAPCTPPPVQPTASRRLAMQLGMAEPASAGAQQRGIRCSAEVSLEQQGRGSGWVAQPAVTDNALQLGPATGDVGKEDDADVTRVVAGMAAYVAVEQVGGSAVLPPARVSCLAVASSTLVLAPTPGRC